MTFYTKHEILKMGSEMSLESKRQQEEYILNQQRLKIEAFARYEARLNSYRLHYGRYEDYIDWCNAQYELECIPEICRSGSMAGARGRGQVFGIS